MFFDLRSCDDSAEFIKINPAPPAYTGKTAQRKNNKEDDLYYLLLNRYCPRAMIRMVFPIVHRLRTHRPHPECSG